MILIISKFGKVIGLEKQSIPVLSRIDSGIKLMKLETNDEIVSIVEIPDTKKGSLLIINKDGVGKRVLIKEFVSQKKGGLGINIDKNIADIVYIKD